MATVDVLVVGGGGGGGSAGSGANTIGSPGGGAGGYRYETNFPIVVNNYSVTVIDANNCSTENQFFVNNISTGIAENDYNLNSNVWPNPASDYLMIYLPDISDNFIEFSIFNNVGQLVFSNQVYMQSDRIIKFNLPDFLKGLYLIKIHTADSKYISKKIVIN